MGNWFVAATQGRQVYYILSLYIANYVISRLANYVMFGNF